MSYRQKPFATLIISFTAAVLSAVSISSAGSGPNMQEGLWEITVKMEMPGMPMNMPSMTHTQCITNEDMVPSGSPQQAEECKITRTKMEGDTVTWTMECDSPEGKTRATGKIIYSGNTFKGTIKMTMKEGMEMTQHLSGRRIGNCKQ